MMFVELGAGEMLKTKTIANTEAGFAGQAEGLQAQEAQTLATLGQAKTEAQQKQAMFNDQMSYAWAEFGETEKNDILNAYALMNSIGVQDWAQRDLDKYNKFINSTYGNRWNNNAYPNLG